MSRATLTLGVLLFVVWAPSHADDPSEERRLVESLYQRMEHAAAAAGALAVEVEDPRSRRAFRAATRHLLSATRLVDAVRRFRRD